MLVLLIFGNSLLLKRVHMLMRCHVDEHFASCAHIFCLHYKALIRLDYHAAFGVDMGFGILLSLRRKLVEEFLHFWGTVASLNLLIDGHQLLISVVS